MQENNSKYEKFKEMLHENVVIHSSPESREYVQETKSKENVRHVAVESFVGNVLKDTGYSVEVLTSLLNESSKEAIESNHYDTHRLFKNYANTYCQDHSDELFEYNNELKKSDASLTEKIQSFEDKIISLYGEDSKELNLLHSTYSTILRRSYKDLETENEFNLFFEKMDGVPRVEESVDLSKVVNVFDDPSIADIGLYHDKIVELASNLPEDNPLHNNIDYLDSIIVTSTSTYTELTHEIAERVGTLSDRDTAKESVQELNKLYKDIDFVNKDSSIEINESSNDKINMVASDGANFNINLDDNFKKEFLEIANSYKKNFFTKPYAAEESTKIYALGGLTKLKNEIKKAIDAKDVEKVNKLTAEYKAKEELFENLLDRTHKLANNNDFTANISVSRNGDIPSKYRNDYIRVSQLGSIHHFVGMCDQLGVTLESVLENPVKGFYDLYNKAISNTTLAMVIDQVGKPSDIFMALKGQSFITEFNELMGQIRGFGRAGAGLFNCYNGPEKDQMRAYISFLSDNVAQAKTFELMSTFMNPLGNAKSLANLFMYKKEDLNIYTLSGDLNGSLSSYGYKKIDMPPLDKYIKDNLTAAEIANRCKEIYKISKEIDSKILEDLNKLLDNVFKSIYPDVNNSLAPHFMNMIKTGTDPVIDNLLNTNEPVNNNPNILDFEAKLNEALSINEPTHATNLAEEVEAQKNNEFNNAKIDYCINAFIEQMESYDITFEELGYTKDLNGVASFLNDYKSGTRPELNDVNLPSDFFNRTMEKSGELYYKLNDIPEDAFVTDDMDEVDRILASDKREALRNAFRNTSDVARSINDKEKSFENPSARATSADVVKKYVEANSNVKDSFKIGDNIAEFKPFVNADTTKALASKISEFKFSDQTKAAFIEVYDKMNSYHMLDEQTVDLFNFGEEPTKVMGLYKYNKAREEYNRALDAKDYDKAFELAPKSQQIINEYLDVYKLAEKVFPQDGLHTNGNISCTRHNYVPYELSSHLQAHIQTNAIFLMNVACKKYGVDFKELVNNPAEGIKKLMQAEKKRVNDIYKEGPKGAIFGRMTNDSAYSNFDKLLSRTLETLTMLESDDKIRENNAFVGIIQEGLRMQMAIREPFAKFSSPECKSNQFTGIDKESLKLFIATGGNRDVYDFATNNVDAVTGEKITAPSYQKVLEEDKRTLEEVYTDLMENLAGGLLQVNRDYEKDNYDANKCTFAHMYAGASAYLQDFIHEKGLEYDNSFVKGLADKFINNPSEEVLKYVDKHFANEKEQFEEFYEMNNGVEQALLDVKEPNPMASQALYYFSTLKDAKISDLLRDFDNLSIDGRPTIHSGNIMEMLLIARRADDLYSNRGAVNRFFSSDATKEHNLTEKIVNYVKELGVDEELITSFINAEYNENNPRVMADKLSAIHAEVSYNEQMQKLKVENIEQTLNEIFKPNAIKNLTPEEMQAYYNPVNQGKNDIRLRNSANEKLSKAPNEALNPANIKKVVSLYKEIKGIKEFTTDDKIIESANKAINALTDSVGKNGLYKDYIELIGEGKLTPEKALEEINGLNKTQEVKPERQNIALDLESGNVIIDLDEISVDDISKEVEKFDSLDNKESKDLNEDLELQ